MRDGAVQYAVAVGLLLALAGCGRSSSGGAPQANAEPSAARVEAGRKLFARCAGCHEVGPKAGNIFGPRLNGIVGAKAGNVAGYVYSPALKASGLVWDASTLAAFIRDSEQVVPGNKMRFMNFMSEKQAGDVVAYLATQTALPPTQAPAAGQGED